MSSAPITIVGAGPAGLSAALALRAIGRDVRVVERAPQLSEQAGVALTLWPNGLRALEAIDPTLPSDLRASGAPTESVRFMDRDGATLAEHRLQIEERYGMPCLNVRWSSLQRTLLERLPSDMIALGREVTHLASAPDDDLALHFRDGTALRSSLVIIADGVHSALRGQLLNDGPPIEHGRFIWRSVIARLPDMREREACFFAGQGQSGTLLDVGHGLGFWSCALVTSERFDGLDLDLTKAKIHASFPQFPEHFHRAVDGAEIIVGRRLLDRAVPAPIAELPLGPAAIIGDACHAMIPTIGQGANQAFEDASELAVALRDAVGIRPALRAFESRRLPRVRVISARAARLGHQVMHSQNADVLRDPLRGITGQEASLVEGDQSDFDAWVYGYRPAPLRNRA